MAISLQQFGQAFKDNAKKALGETIKKMPAGQALTTSFNLLNKAKPALQTAMNDVNAARTAAQTSKPVTAPTNSGAGAMTKTAASNAMASIATPKPVGGVKQAAPVVAPTYSTVTTAAPTLAPVKTTSVAPTLRPAPIEQALVTPAKPVVEQPPIDTVDPVRQALAQLQSQYTALLSPSQREQELKSQLAQYMGTQAQNIAGLEGQGRNIPLGLVRGKQKALTEQTNLQAQTLQNEIANEQDAREAQAQALGQQLSFAQSEIERQDALAAQAREEAQSAEQRAIELQTSMLNAGYQPLSGGLAQLTRLGLTQDDIVEIGGKQFIAPKGTPKVFEVGNSLVDELGNVVYQGSETAEKPFTVGAGSSIYDPATGTFLTAPGGGDGYGSGTSTFGREKDSKYLTDAGKLYDDFNANQTVKDFVIQQNGYQNAMSIDNNSASSQDDIALIYSFMKVLDPGSVVREGEFDTASKYTGVLDKLGIKFNRVMKGNLLSAQQRQNIKNALESRYNIAKGNYQQVESSFANRAQAMGIDPTDVIIDYSGFVQPDVSEQQIDVSSYQPNAQAVKTYTGRQAADGSKITAEEADYLGRYTTYLQQQGKTNDEIAKEINSIMGFNSVGGDTKQASLGSLSERYESGGDPGAIGYDSTGGYSYGAYQLAHQNAKKFVEQSPFAEMFKGLAFNSKAFQNKWKEVAKQYGDQFKQAQKDYIAKTHFEPQLQKLASAGINVNSLPDVLKDVIWSTAVQHGANTDVVAKAMKSLKQGATVADAIKAIYNERWAGGQRFASSTQAVKNAVYNRFFGENGELNQALSRLNVA